MSKGVKTKYSDLENRVTAQGLLRYSEVYYNAFFSIISREEDHNFNHFYPAIYFLAFHSIELSLKSILRKEGYSLEQLIDGYGHNLEDLSEEIIRKRYLILTKKELAIIRLVGKLYKSKQFEYIQVGLKSLPTELDVNLVSSRILDKAKVFFNK